MASAQAAHSSGSTSPTPAPHGCSIGEQSGPTYLSQLPVLYAVKQLCTMPAHAQAAVGNFRCFCHWVSQCVALGFIGFRP